MLQSLDDTIVAVSTGGGASVRGIIRLSGPRSFELADRVYACSDAGGPLAARGGYCRVMGRVTVGDAGSLPAEAYLFRSPASYTRQDVVELHTVGSPAVLSMLLDQLLGDGARLAEPGEFTARAFLGGALDLTRAEGVAALIHARSDTQLRAAQALLQGGLSRRSMAGRERLADLLALIEAEIDFAEEPIQFVTLADAAATLDAVGADIEELLAQAPSAERLDMLPEVLLIGRPNVGKSTLLNRLSGVDRVIASAVAGTTRDVVTSPLMVPGGEVLLQDSAGLGLHETSTASASCSALHELHRQAEWATRQALVRADLVLVVMDASAVVERSEDVLGCVVEPRRLCVVLNKADAVPKAELARRLGEFERRGEDALAVSALTGEGLGALRERIGHAVFVESKPHAADVLALSARQRKALQEALFAMRRARDLCDTASDEHVPTELLALELREATHALSLLVGEVTTEDLLDRVFSRFCIGK
ncbi:MAG: tRNA modification GTPase [Phycisphaerae bacterium]|nr:tRNA modification GTPase [Phycisphaerae bacterium]